MFSTPLQLMPHVGSQGCFWGQAEDFLVRKTPNRFVTRRTGSVNSPPSVSTEQASLPCSLTFSHDFSYITGHTTCFKRPVDLFPTKSSALVFETTSPFAKNQHCPSLLSQQIRDMEQSVYVQPLCSLALNTTHSQQSDTQRHGGIKNIRDQFFPEEEE